jgi:hypothetical protein
MNWILFMPNHSCAGVGISTEPWDSADACPLGQVNQVNGVTHARLPDHAKRRGERCCVRLLYDVSVMNLIVGAQLHPLHFDAAVDILEFSTLDSMP